MTRVLIVDDEASIRTTLSEFLRDEGYDVEDIESAEQAVWLLKEKPFDVVVSDIVLPKVSGLELLHHIHRTSPEIKVILITGRPTMDTAIAAVRSGASDYLLKPVKQQHIIKAVGNVAKIKELEDTNRKLFEENRNHREHLEGLIEERIAELKRSEERYRILYEHSPLPYQSLDYEGRIIEANQVWLEMMGYSRSEVIGRWFGEFLVDRHLDHFRKSFSEFQQDGACTGNEFDMVRKDGQVRSVAFTGRVSYDDHGDFSQSHCVFLDITEQKKAEQGLKESEERYRSLFDVSNDAILIHKVDGQIIHANAAALELTGYSYDEIITTTIFDHHPKSELENVYHAKEESQKTGRIKFESKLVRKDGSCVDVDISGSTIDKEKGIMQGIVRDITLRKNAERAIQASEKRFRELLENVRLIAVMLDNDGKISFCNHSLCKLLGYGPEDLKGRLWFDIALPDHACNKVSNLFFDNIQKGEMPSTFTNEIQTRLGEIRKISWNNTVLRDPEGAIIGTASIGEDITEREQTELALRDSEERYRRLTEHAPDMIWRTNFKGSVVYVNQAVENILGYTPAEAVGQSIKQYFSEKSVMEITEWIREALSSNPPENSFSGEAEYISKQGRIVPCEIRATMVFDEKSQVIAVEGISRDITQRKQAEAKLIEYQKHLRELASQLTLVEERQRREIASLLHDSVCQDLALVIAQLKMLKSKTEDSESKASLDENLFLVQKAVDEARSLTYDLSPPVLYDFGLVAALQWLFDKMEANLQIKTEFNYPEQRISLNEELSVLLYTSVREVLVNIIKHAKADSISGTIDNHDHHLQIKISDNGIGFKANEKQLGDEEPRGMGIFGIRERLYHFGGTMDLESTPGKGTKVTISVPIS